MKNIRKMLWRCASLVLCVILLCSLFVGCGKDPADTSSDDGSVSGDGDVFESGVGEDTSNDQGENSDSSEGDSGDKNPQGGSQGGSSNNPGTSSGSGSVASAVLGKKKTLTNLSLKTPSGNDYTFTTKAKKDAWLIAGKNTVLSVKLSDAFKKQAGTQDLLITISYFGAVDGNFSISYVQGSKTVKEKVYVTKSNTWSKCFARLHNVKYGGMSGQDFELVFDGITTLNVASIEVVASKVQIAEGSGVVKETNLAFNTPHVVKTKYTTEESVVADATVTYFGAVGDGKTDDTDAFQAAILYVSKKGGGTVFVPEGKYVIRSALTLPAGVTLRGEAPMADGKSAVKGTVLYSYVGKNSTAFYEDKPFITLKMDSGVRDMAIFYPEQTLAGGKATPYSWTIKMEYMSTAENIFLVNSYKGIQIGPQANNMTVVRNVWGTPLSYGIFIDHSVDIARFQNINFSAAYWLNSGLGAPSKSTLASWLKKEATGFMYERVDWTYFWDFTIDGYKIGMHTRKSTAPKHADPGTAGGQIYNAKITNCTTGLLVEDVTWAGVSLTNSTISATGGEDAVAIKISSNFDSSYMINGCTLKSEGTTVLTSDGSGAVVLTNCSVSGTSNSKRLINMAKNGKFSSINSTYSGGNTHVRLSSKVTGANLVNNMTKATFKLLDETGGKNTKMVYDSEKAPVTPTNIKYDITYTTKPSKAQLIDVSNAPYNITPTAKGKGKDVSGALQKALNDMKKAGGGIVYVPAGDYRLDSPITIPTGVELRGSSDIMIHFDGHGTTFYTKYGRGNMSAAPLVVLSENSGISGLRIFHDQQKWKSFEKYPFTIQGRGSDCYVVNVMLPNAYQGIDFASYRCDRHFLMSVYGCQLKTGIIVGGGSKDGVMRDCHYNCNAWVWTGFVDATDGSSYAERLDKVRAQQMAGADCFIVEKTTNEVLYTNFVYGCDKGFVLRGGADFFMMGNAVDGGATTMQVEDIVTGKTTWMIGNQLCSISKEGEATYVHVTEKFAGDINIVQTTGFAAPPYAGIFEGSGTVRLVNYYASDNMDGIKITAKNSQVIGCYLRDPNPANDIRIEGNGVKSLLFGNLFDKKKNPNIFVGGGATASGSDS